MDLDCFAAKRDIYALCEDELRSAIRSQVYNPNLIPDFMIIGAPRAGTTYLSAALNHMPEMFVVPEKELKFFSANLIRFSYSWYLSRFASGLGKIKGEATPSYASLPTSRIQLIYEMNPQMKLIYILREPCARLASEWKYVFQKRDDWSEHQISSYVLSDGPVVMSDYAENLSRWLSIFPKEQILVLFHDQLTHDPQGLLARVVSFLGGSSKPDPFGDAKINDSWIDERIQAVVDRATSALFAPRIRKLKAMLAECWPDIGAPNWVSSDVAKQSGDLGPTLALNSDRSVIPMEGHFVCGAPSDIERCSSLEEVRRAQSRGVKVGIGYYQVEAIANVLLRENLVENRLYSLSHGDTQFTDLFLVREGYFGWNIVFFKNAFFAAKILAGHFDLRSVAQDELDTLIAQGDLRCFGHLQEALDSLRPKDVLRCFSDVDDARRAGDVY